MGTINDIVRRGIKGTPNRETLTTAFYELYSSDYTVRIVRMGTHRNMKHKVCTCGAYPFIVLTIDPLNVRKDDMMVKDRDEKYVYVDVSRYSPVHGITTTIRYNHDCDYMASKNENGKIHTTEELLKDAEWFIDRILEKDYLYMEEYLKDIYRPDSAKKFKKSLKFIWKSRKFALSLQ